MARTKSKTVGAWGANQTYCCNERIKWFYGVRLVCSLPILTARQRGVPGSHGMTHVLRRTYLSCLLRQRGMAMVVAKLDQRYQHSLVYRATYSPPANMTTLFTGKGVQVSLSVSGSVAIKATRSSGVVT